ncbi:MAG: hypothetical protein FJ304_09855 [Planctomycetes bacterium]|nr:hypothetical protein [Planctomycetota bacterium]
MRTALVGAVLLGAAALGGGQPPKEKEKEKDPPPITFTKEPDPRFGVRARVKQFPQGAPKEALKSALAALEARDFAYLAAHLLEPKFVDAAVTERARDYLPGAEAQLAQLREFQRANAAKIDPENRVPIDPVAFRALAAQKARDLGFKQFQKDIEQKLTDDPQVLRDFRKLAREGTFADADPAATATHADVKDRTLYFKKIGDRWFLENRQSDEPKP